MFLTLLVVQPGVLVEFTTVNMGHPTLAGLLQLVNKASSLKWNFEVCAFRSRCEMPP